VEEFRNIEISFMDKSEHNLEMVRALCQRDIDSNKLSIKIEAQPTEKSIKKCQICFCNSKSRGLEAFAPM
jgi:alpha-galactosidase